MGERARRSAFTAQPEAGEALRGFLTLAPAPTPIVPLEAPAVEDPADAQVDTHEDTTGGTASLVEDAASQVSASREPSLPSGATADVGEEQGADLWTVVLPTFRAPSVRSAHTEELLTGPLRTVPLSLPVPIANALQEYALRLAVEGHQISRQTLVAHGLAFAYTHSEEWVKGVPADSRRAGAPVELTRGARKTTFRLPERLETTTLALMLRALKGRENQAASRLSFIATALAFALNRAGEWVDVAVANPVR